MSIVLELIAGVDTEVKVEVFSSGYRSVVIFFVDWN